MLIPAVSVALILTAVTTLYTAIDFFYAFATAAY
jgi:hypothetical protein